MVKKKLEILSDLNSQNYKDGKLHKNKKRN